MKIFVVASIFISILSSCTSLNQGKLLGDLDHIYGCGKSEVVYESGKFVRCEPGKNPTLTGNAPQVSAEIILKPKAVVLGENDYVTKINLLHLRAWEAEEIAENVLKHKVIQYPFNEEIWTREFQEKPLNQGNWKARYNPSQYPSKKYDSITVTMSGKTYTFDGIAYGKETIASIEKMRKEGSESPEIYATSFGGFHSFSPSGKYILYEVNGWEYSDGYALEIRTGKTLKFRWKNHRGGKAGGLDGSISMWTPDKTRFIFGENGELNITRKDVFPVYDGFEYELSHTKDTTDKEIAQYFLVDNTYAYALTEYENYYYLNIIDLEGNYVENIDTYKYKEVYSGMVKKEK